MRAFFQGFNGRLTHWVFYIQVTVSLLFWLGFALEYLMARTADPVRANAIYPYYIEHLLASLPILLGSLLLTEAHERELNQR